LPNRRFTGGPGWGVQLERGNDSMKSEGYYFANRKTIKATLGGGERVPRKEKVGGGTQTQKEKGSRTLGAYKRRHRYEKVLKEFRRGEKVEPDTFFRVKTNPTEIDLRKRLRVIRRSLSSIEKPPKKKRGSQEDLSFLEKPKGSNQMAIKNKQTGHSRKGSPNGAGGLTGSRGG